MPTSLARRMKEQLATERAESGTMTEMRAGVSEGD
jgi:hypothetical protein